MEPLSPQELGALLLLVGAGTAALATALWFSDRGPWRFDFDDVTGMSIWTPWWGLVVAADSLDLCWMQVWTGVRVYRRRAGEARPGERMYDLAWEHVLRRRRARGFGV